MTCEELTLLQNFIIIIIVWPMMKDCEEVCLLHNGIIINICCKDFLFLCYFSHVFLCSFTRFALSSNGKEKKFPGENGIVLLYSLVLILLRKC